MARYLPALILVLTTLVSIPTTARIMKCIATDGGVTYANSCASGEQATEMQISDQINTIQGIALGSGTSVGPNSGSNSTTIIGTDDGGFNADMPASGGGLSGTSGGGGSSGGASGSSGASGGGDGTPGPDGGDGTPSATDGGEDTASTNPAETDTGGSSSTSNTTSSTSNTGSFNATGAVTSGSGNDTTSTDTTSTNSPFTGPAPQTDSIAGSGDTGAIDTPADPTEVDTGPPVVENADPEPPTILFFTESPSTDINYTISSILINSFDKEISVTGNNFGTGPNVVLFDTFNNGVTGEIVPLTNSNNPACSTDITGLNTPQGQGPVIGCWSEYGSNRPRYSSIARSGSHSMQAHDNSTGMLQIKKAFGKITEAFISYWVHVPQTTVSFFPGAFWFRPDGSVGGIEAAKNYIFPKDSSWKMAWLLQDGKFDALFANLVLPTYTGLGIIQLAGNDNTVANLGMIDKWWSWDHWNRLSVWVRADTDDPTGPGDFNFQAVSEDMGFFQASSANTPIFDTDGPAEKYFNSINFPGWIREGSKTNPLYDDIYVAIGPGSVSRVEIGNAATYHTSNRVQLLRNASWTNTEIRVLFDEDPGFAPGPNTWLYITDNDGRVNLDGYPLN